LHIALIHNSGLLKRKYIRKLPDAYKLYRSRSSEDQPDGRESIEFRHQYCLESHPKNVNPDKRETEQGRVPIKALCCWDSVGSLGLPDLPYFPLSKEANKKYQFFDTNVNHLVENAIHAVAIDEIRKVFNVTPMTPSPDRKENPTAIEVIEVWFPGGHGSVGGGSQEEQGLSDGALRWMIDRVKNLGLELDENQLDDDEKIQPNYAIPFDNALKPPFSVGGRNLRKVSKFADLHDTAIKRWRDPKLDPLYRPENLRAFQKEFDL
jgi:uncharacterized protein (DUF2235 family)